MNVAKGSENNAEFPEEKKMICYNFTKFSHLFSQNRLTQNFAFFLRTEFDKL